MFVSLLCKCTLLFMNEEIYKGFLLAKFLFDYFCIVK